MKDWIKEKLRIIDDLYPAERLERSKQRLRKIWSGEMPDDRYPFVHNPIILEYYGVHPPEERLRLSLDECIFRGRIEDDFIPTLFPGCRQGTIPSMLGAKEIVVGNDYSSERIIHSVDDIDRIPEPFMGPGTVAHEWLEMEKYFLEETEGRLPINVTDMQGPVEVCAKLWGYEDFFMETYTNPEACMKLMDKMTDAFILFWEAQQQLLGKNFVGTHLWGWNWVPENCGATISSDGVVMVSPEFYDAFYNPSTVRIGEYFGGVTIHTCGNPSKVLKNMISPSCVKGVNFGEMRMRSAIEAGMSKICICFSSMEETKEDFLAAKAARLPCVPTIVGLWKENKPEQWTEQQWREMEDRHKMVEEWAHLS